MPPRTRTNRFKEDDEDVVIAPREVEPDDDDVDLVPEYVEPAPRRTRATRTVEPEPEEEEEEEGVLPLTENARVSVTIGTQFSYRNHSHWPKVKIEDGPFPIVDEEGQPLGWEDTEDMLYRIEENAHQRLDVIIARMKHDIDARIVADAARVRAERGLPTT